MVAGTSEPREQVVRRWKDFFTQQNCLIAAATILLAAQLWVVASLRHFSRDMATASKTGQQLFLDLQGHVAREAHVASETSTVSEPATSPLVKELGHAVELSRNAATSGDFDLAEVYLVNAISRMPENVPYLTEYAQLVQKRPNLQDDDLDRLTSVLQLALYRVTSEHVKTVQDLLTEAEKQRTAVRRPEVQPRNVQGDFEGLVQAAPQSFDNRAAIEHYVESLHSLAAEVDSDEAKLLGAIDAEATKYKSLLQILQNCDYVDNCLTNLAKLREKNELASDQAVAIVQSAENGLPLFWGQDLASLPEVVRVKLGSYPTTVRNWVDEIAEARSAPAWAVIKELRAKSDKPQGKKYEEKCITIEKQIEEARDQFALITSPKIAKQAQNELTAMSQSLAKERKEQFNAHQQAVLAKCADVFDNYLGHWVVSETDARKWFVDAKLAEIDQGLLSSEVARCLNDLLSRLFAEVSPKTLLECEKDMGSTKKISLEDF